MTFKKNTQLTNIPIGRRKFLTYSGGVLAAAAASTLPSPAVHAASTVKIGFVSPQTGPLAPFGETDKFVLKLKDY